MHQAHNQIAQNPFAMLLDPERIARAVESSERLNRLHSRICRPLDKPVIARREASDADAFDALVDASIVEAEAEDEALDD